MDDATLHIELDVADEKNCQGNGVAVQDDLADDLRAWLDDRLALLQDDACQRADPNPALLSAGTAVFDVPAAWSASSTAICKPPASPIATIEAEPWTYIHCGTLLSKSDVSLRTAQAGRRHSDPKLTDVYTDPRLLDVAEALDSLPGFPLNQDPQTSRERT
ncbi:MAG: hypothetical protein ABI353_00055 [Isosphaeraceae bacterium]